jgi:hypothetical protein
MRSWILTVLIPIVLLLFQGMAAADGVDRLVAQLEGESDHKLRLSAAINLGKLGDKRAIPALTEALSDSNDSVRGAAAASLGILVDASTDQKTRQRVLTVLDRLVKRDGSDLVRKQAERAQVRIRKLPTQSAPSGGIYVNIGAMATKAAQAPGKLKQLMRSTTEQTFSKRASSMMTSWPAGGEPSTQQLRASKTSAFHIDGTLVTLETQNKGGATLVSCKVSMLIATFPEKSMFGFLDGGARVESGSSPSEIQYAQEDCVTAVVEDLVSRKIIPVIQQRHASQSPAAGSSSGGKP